jgi:hypothetical protein
LKSSARQASTSACTSARLEGNRTSSSRDDTNKYYPLIARAVERLDRNADETRRAVYERARKAIAQLRSNQPALLDADITKERLALKRRFARWRPKRPPTHQGKYAPRRGRRLSRRANPMVTKFNPATAVSRFHRIEVIGRRRFRADEYQYYWPSRRMTATTQIFRRSRLAELTAPITIAMMSRARARGTVCSS